MELLFDQRSSLQLQLYLKNDFAVYICIVYRTPKAYSGPCQTSNGCQLLTIFAKNIGKVLDTPLNTIATLFLHALWSNALNCGLKLQDFV